MIPRPQCQSWRNLLVSLGVMADVRMVWPYYHGKPENPYHGTWQSPQHSLTHTSARPQVQEERQLRWRQQERWQNMRISQHPICFSQSYWRHWAQSMTRQLISCRSWEAEFVRPPAVRSESASSSSSGFPWQYSVLTQFFCTTLSLNVTIRTSGLSRLLILAFFYLLTFGIFTTKGTKNNNTNIQRFNSILLHNSFSIDEDWPLQLFVYF